MNCCEMQVHLLFPGVFFLKQDRVFLHKIKQFRAWSGKPLPDSILFY